MKQIFKIKYETIRQKFPVLERVHRRVRDGRLFDSMRKKIRGHGNVIVHRDAILSSVIFDIVGNNNRIEIQKGALLNAVTFRIRGDQHQIMIGEECRFDHGGSIWFQDYGGSLEIGQGSTFQNAHLAVTEPGSKIYIGSDCMFAYDIEVRTGDSHSALDANSLQRINPAEDVFIGNHVWVAAHCILLKGVHIAENSIIGTGAVVTGKFTQKGVALAGSPARVIKEGITWSRKRI